MTTELALLRQEAAFLNARAATDRGAALRWFHAEGIDVKKPEVLAEAKKRWSQLPFLLSQDLLSISSRALEAARGKQLEGTEKFKSVLWLNGATNTYGGRQFLGTISDFVKLLRDRAHATAAKREGWVIEPTTNPNGRRTNEETLAVHALFLDCDGTGTWDRLLATLDVLDYCYVAYQSGGWSPTSPKWRVVLPLHTPHETRTDAAIQTWKTIYNHARVVFGACAQLLSYGFDPATETPCCPWFLTEKRDANDPERQVVARIPGRALDLTQLALALPEVAEEGVIPDAVERVVNEMSVDEVKLNEIIDALAKATINVPTGRRDLYLALPGALLDRGIPADDVIAIIEAVSLSYPRKHADKHADNMHNARTTISRWHSKTHYTRIGTLQNAAPAVAAALDSVLPSAAQQLALATEQMLLEYSAPTVPAPVVGQEPSPQVQRKIRRQKRNVFGREVSQIASKLRGAKQVDNRVAGMVVNCFLDGMHVPTAPETTDEQVDDMVASAMRALGRNLVVSTKWATVLEFAGQTLGLMNIAQSVSRVATAERAFYEGQGKRNRSNLKKAAKVAAWNAERVLVYGDKGR